MEEKYSRIEQETMYIYPSSLTFLTEAEAFIRNYCSPLIEYSYIGTLVLIAEEKLLAFNLIETGKYQLTPYTMVDIAEKYQAKNLQIINIWEDVWYNRNEQVKSIIKAKLGYFKTIFARKTNVVKITKTELDDFMNKNHLMGTTSSKYKYGLVCNGSLTAVASFAPIRKYYNKTGFNNSAELVRYANLMGTVTIGGLSKLISFFVKERNPDDIMSYADRDWSAGKVYILLGFYEKEITPPKKFAIGTENCTRMSISAEDETDFPIYNTGNIKFVKAFNQIGD